MLTQLPTLKARLAIDPADPQYDALLTNALNGISARFDHECNRTLARTADALYEFDPGDTELILPCYPIETVTKFELKGSETGGWAEIEPAPDYLIRSSGILSVRIPADVSLNATCLHPLARVTYTGGYVLPGTTPAPGQTPLPDDLEQAAIEQTAFWFQTRDQVGIIREWPKGGTYLQFEDIDLVPSVRATLAKYTRWS